MKPLMNPAAILGLVLIVISAVVLISGGGFTSQHEMMKIGDLKVTTNEQRAIPPWAAALGVVAGVVLVASSTRRRA